MEKHKDKHGYEIIGLHSARTPKAKKECLEKHLGWLQRKQVEVEGDIKDKIQTAELKMRIKEKF